MSKTQKRSTKNLPATRPVEGLIHVVRNQKVMLDADLANLYGVPTFRLNEAVKRNIRRFPDDFMFRLSSAETQSLTSQIAISNKRGGRRTFPYAFTEPGVAMLSSVLIMRAFIRMRELVATNKDIAVRVEKLEQGHRQTDSVIEVLVEDIDQLAHEVKLIKNPLPGKKQKIGYILNDYAAVKVPRPAAAEPLSSRQGRESRKR